MIQPRLNHTLLSFIHKDRVDEIKEEKIAETFIGVNDKRRRYFGSFTES